MRTLTYIADDKLKKTVIPIGFVGENEHTRVIFVCEKIYAEYPDAVPAISVRPPVGNEYPSIVVREGNNVYWDVTDADLTHRGLGEVQLTFTQGTVVAKTYTAGTMIEKSIMGNGPAPSAIDDFIARASAAVAEIPQTINSALEEAKESGEFDGEDGFSPIISIVDIVGGHRMTIVDEEGTHTADIMDGLPGQDGYSPTVTVTNIDGGHRVTITDKYGNHTFDVMDGSAASTFDYNNLFNKPKVNNVELTGNKSLYDLNINQIHKYSFDIGKNDAQVEMLWTASTVWYGDPEFTNNARVVGYNAPQGKYYDGIYVVIDRRSIEVTVGLLPGAPAGTLELYISETI